MMHRKHQDLAPIPHTPHHHLTKMASPHQVSLAVKGWTRAWMGRKLKPLPIVLAAAVDEAKWWRKEEDKDGDSLNCGGRKQGLAPLLGTESS